MRSLFSFKLQNKTPTSKQTFGSTNVEVSSGGFVDGSEHVEHGSLASSTRAENAHKLSSLDGERHSSECRDALDSEQIRLVDVVAANDDVFLLFPVSVCRNALVIYLLLFLEHKTQNGTKEKLQKENSKDRNCEQNKNEKRKTTNKKKLKKTHLGAKVLVSLHCHAAACLF